KRKRKRKR
nr:Chain C, (KR)4 [synthetic construct]5MFI_D Chain D, (KR)4 [synthetic construct]5MFK_C Chain C, (KR)4 [synthetic construct]5MFK_D Chain D, (KR)4 [synthetic construct]